MIEEYELLGVILMDVIIVDKNSVEIFSKVLIEASRVVEFNRSINVES